jgi:acetyltransferase
MSLEKFFNPASVAIIGASATPGKVGYEILANMIKAGYKGKIFPVNSQAKTLEGLACYPDIQSIGQTPDLVVIVVPA